MLLWLLKLEPFLSSFSKRKKETNVNLGGAFQMLPYLLITFFCFVYKQKENTLYCLCFKYTQNNSLTEILLTLIFRCFIFYSRRNIKEIELKLIELKFFFLLFYPIKIILYSVMSKRKTLLPIYCFLSSYFFLGDVTHNLLCRGVHK